MPETLGRDDPERVEALSIYKYTSSVEENKPFPSLVERHVRGSSGRFTSKPVGLASASRADSDLESESSLYWIARGVFEIIFDNVGGSEKMRSVKIVSVICLAMALLGMGQQVEWEWFGKVQMPSSLSKDKQQEVADCIIAKVNTPDLKEKLVGMFPSVPKKWIQGIQIRTVDATKVMDSHGEGIEVWIEMPSSKEAYSSSSPVVEYLASVIKNQIGICSAELKSS